MWGKRKKTHLDLFYFYADYKRSYRPLASDFQGKKILHRVNFKLPPKGHTMDYATSPIVHKMAPFPFLRGASFQIHSGKCNLLLKSNSLLAMRCLPDTSTLYPFLLRQKLESTSDVQMITIVRDPQFLTEMGGGQCIN